MDVDDQDQQQQPDMKNGVKVEDEVNPPIIRGTGNRYILPTYKISDKYQFFDYIGMVVSYQLQTNDRAVMLLTDYTENPRPMDGYAAEGTVDPKLIIQGTLWDEHAEGSEKLSLKFGDVVYVRNLAAKSSKSNALELTLRGEKNTRAGYGAEKDMKNARNRPQIELKLSIHQIQLVLLLRKLM
ncbi:hypothetical protein BDA99DRAFT_247051 [Phascolomyces articulosus]|uniref:Protection of telomeres protein 1 ssDNA-binding domain-containing protein n=1 Tax=Phascolomyces articulosus TaxID=60185 RepID=A0AAD5KS87_9FUNG|nr:hypothetical protein BDA99DRAFT_247051 [Phascolomyces articulosus]